MYKNYLMKELKNIRNENVLSKGMIPINEFIGIQPPSYEKLSKLRFVYYL